MIFSLTIFCIGYIIVENKQSHTLLAKDGFMDLSGWDFQKNGKVTLDGDWGFYPGVLLEPEELNNQISSQITFLHVPGRWSEDERSDISDKGVGTYRLTIRVKDGSEMYGIKIMNIRTASKIFVNGRNVGNSGNPAISFENGYISNVIPIIAFFSAENNTIDIVIQVANLDYYNGGIIQNVYFGTQKQILRLYFQQNLLDISVVTSVVLCAMCSMLFYFKLREDKRFLYLSLLCIMYAFICATTNGKILNTLFPLIPYILTIKLKLSCICCGIIVICLFIRNMNPGFMPLRFLKAIAVIIITNLSAVMLAPNDMTGLLEKITGMGIILIYLLMMILLIKSIINQKYGELDLRTALIVLGGVFALSLDYILAALYFYSKINIYAILTFPLLILIVVALLYSHYAGMYTRMRNLSSRLIEADEAKDEFLITTAYEFRMPLHAVLNLTRVIMEDSEGSLSEDQEERLNYIMETASRLSTLVNDIIDFESIKDNRFHFNKKVFDINGTIQAVLDLLAPLKNNGEIRFFSRVIENTYFLHTDEEQFIKIILNLTGSFLKYAKRGELEVKAERKMNYIYLRISYTGVAMDASALMSDLGVSISRLLIFNMGGEIYLENTEPEHGICFVIKLPEAEDVLKKKSISESTEKVKIGFNKAINKKKNLNMLSSHADSLPLQRQKILIVDDDPMIIMVLKDILEVEKYEVMTAYNGITAMELIKKHKDFSLIILDVIMPGLSGFEVCRRIRTEFPLFELPILLLTTRSTPEEIEAGLDAGANDLLTKPLHYKELMARVKTLQKIKESMAKAIKMESVFLQSQIKPHFLYNALNVIVSLCYRDGERAGLLLGELSNYLREAFEIDHQNSFISIKRELALVNSYVELEKARFGERLTVEYYIAEEVLEHLIPAFTIQPIIENSIRHGLMKRLSGGRVRVTVTSEDGVIRIIILDDGVGIPADRLSVLLTQNNVGSIGLKNVNKRLMLEYGKGLMIESKEGEWTQISMDIPI